MSVERSLKVPAVEKRALDLAAKTLSQEEIASRLKSKLKRQEEKMVARMNDKHNKRMRILLQMQQADDLRVKESVRKQRQLASELRKRREDELIARRKRDPGPDGFRSISEASLLLHKEQARGGKDHSASSLPILSPLELAKAAKAKENAKKKLELQRQLDAQRRRTEQKRQTEEYFAAHYRKIEEKKMHMKAREEIKNHQRLVRRREQEIEREKKNRALTERLDKAMASQEEMLSLKYEKFRCREEQQYFKQVEQEFLQELKEEESEQRRAELARKRKGANHKRDSVDRARVKDLLRRELEMDQKLKSYHEEVQEKWKEMRAERDFKREHGKNVYTNMIALNDAKRNDLLARRHQTEQRLQLFHEEVEMGLQKLREDADDHDRYRLEIRERVYQQDRERAEMIATIADSRSHRHDRLLQIIQLEREHSIRKQSAIRDAKIKRQQEEKEDQARIRELWLQEKVEKRVMRMRKRGENNVGSPQSSPQSSGASMSCTNHPKERKKKSAEQLLAELEQLRDRQAFQMDCILNEEEQNEQRRTDTEITCDPTLRAQITKDFARQRRLAVERIRRIQEENEIVLYDRLNAYHRHTRKTQENPGLSEGKISVVDCDGSNILRE
jgi:hypothetical protein